MMIDSEPVDAELSARIAESFAFLEQAKTDLDFEGVHSAFDTSKKFTDYWEWNNDKFDYVLKVSGGNVNRRDHYRSEVRHHITFGELVEYVHYAYSRVSFPHQRLARPSYDTIQDLLETIWQMGCADQTKWKPLY